MQKGRAGVSGGGAATLGTALVKVYPQLKAFKTAKMDMVVTKTL